MIDHAAPTLNSNHSRLLHFCWTTIIKFYRTHFHILLKFDLQDITLAPSVFSCIGYGLWCVLIRLNVLSKVNNFTSIADRVDIFIYSATLDKAFDPIFLRHDFVILNQEIFVKHAILSQSISIFFVACVELYVPGARLFIIFAFMGVVCILQYVGFYLGCDWLSHFELEYAFISSLMNKRLLSQVFILLLLLRFI